MSKSPSVRPRARSRLLLRIYFVSAGFLVATLLAFGWALDFTREAREEPVSGGPLDWVASLVPVGSTPEQVRQNVAEASQKTRRSVTVHRLSGEVVAEGRAHFPAPLSATELETLRARGQLVRQEHCPPGGCPVAVALREEGKMVGYAWVGPVARGPRRGPPPTPLVPILVALVGLGIAALVLSRNLAKPLGQLADMAHAFGEGNLSVRTRLERKDELGEVARAFDQMADRVQSLMRGQSELIANVAHELRTPLARIRLAMDLAIQKELEQSQGPLAEMATDFHELESLVSDILTAARVSLTEERSGIATALKASPVWVEALVQESATRFRFLHPQRALEIDVEPELPLLSGDYTLLRRAVENLLENARKYSEPQSKIQLFARSAGEHVQLEVADQGIGIDSEDLPKLFTPFFRTDRSRGRKSGGVGLGLALVKRIVEAHGGEVQAQSRVGEGTRIRLNMRPRKES